MAPELKLIVEYHCIRVVVLVVPLYVVQYLYLVLRRLLILLSVFGYLQCHVVVKFMVEAFDNMAETPDSQEF